MILFQKLQILFHANSIFFCYRSTGSPQGLPRGHAGKAILKSTIYIYIVTLYSKYNRALTF